ncbi:MAG: universal stress protein [Acidobacteria bacterium]|nr:universal stress protein [Acidobacteriota bacterium]
MIAPPFDSIVCPIDFSVCSANALRWAAWLAQTSNKPLRLLHAVHVDMPSYLTPKHRADILEQWAKVRAEAETHMRIWVQPHVPEGLDVHFEVSDAPPVEAIIAAAHRENSWVVMGTHGRTGWREVWMGSVTTRTIEQAKVPVLAIPPDKKLC